MSSMSSSLWTEICPFVLVHLQRFCVFSFAPEKLQHSRLNAFYTSMTSSLFEELLRPVGEAKGDEEDERGGVTRLETSKYLLPAAVAKKGKVLIERVRISRRCLLLLVVC